MMKEQMLKAFPEGSAVFDAAVDRALAAVHREAMKEEKRRMPARRAAAWCLAAVLLLAGAIGAAEIIRPGVMDFLTGRQSILPQAGEQVQPCEAQKTVGHTTVRVTETLFDGTAVRLVMSVRNDTVRRPLTPDEPQGAGEFGAAVQKDGVTVLGSFDWFTVDGVRHGITAGSGGLNTVGAEDGEAIVWLELVMEDVPEGDFILGLPVCAEGSDEARQLFVPIRRADRCEARSLVLPGAIALEGTSCTVTVITARLSPVRNVCEVRLDVPDSVDEEAAWAAIAPWQTPEWVDADGNSVGDVLSTACGLPAGETDAARHLSVRIELSPLPAYPPEVYIAPVRYGVHGEREADMRLAIRLGTEE